LLQLLTAAYGTKLTCGSRWLMAASEWKADPIRDYLRRPPLTRTGKPSYCSPDPGLSLIR